MSYALLLPMNTEIRENRRNTARSATTIVEPTGVENRIEDMMANAAHTTEITAEHTITLRKLLNTRIAASAGNMIRAEMRSEPTRFIASTIIIAVTIAISRL